MILRRIFVGRLTQIAIDIRMNSPVETLFVIRIFIT